MTEETNNSIKNIENEIKELKVKYKTIEFDKLLSCHKPEYRYFFLIGRLRELNPRSGE